MRLNDQGIRARVWLKLGGAWRLEALGWGLKRCLCEVCGGATAENEDTQGKPQFPHTFTHFSKFISVNVRSWSTQIFVEFSALPFDVFLHTFFIFPNAFFLYFFAFLIIRSEPFFVY